MNPFAQWQTFYQIVGSAAGALTGLQFVALALIADIPFKSGEEGVEVFSSPTIVHFVAALLLAGSVVMPWAGSAPAALCWVLGGACGLVVMAMVAYSMQKQTVYQAVLEDWLCHLVLPTAAYAGLVADGLCLRSHMRGALFGVADVALLLLAVGIHNSWDNLTYLITMRRQQANSTQTQTR